MVITGSWYPYYIITVISLFVCFSFFKYNQNVIYLLWVQINLLNLLNILIDNGLWPHTQLRSIK